MARLLHLIPLGAPYEARRSVDQLLAKLKGTHDVRLRTIGTGGDYRNTLQAVRALRRERFDLVHAWGTPALLAAALAGSGRLVFTPPLPQLPRTVRLLRAVMAHGDVQVIVPSATVDRQVVQGGVDAARCHLIRPAVDFSKLRRRRDAGLRAAMGFGDDDVVLLAVGESTRAAAHERAAWAVSILRVPDRRFRLLLWRGGETTAKVVRFAERSEHERPVVVADQTLKRRVEYEEALAAADLAVVTADEPVAPLPIATTMAAGVPIVAVATYATSELLEDRHTALMVSKPMPRLIARRVLDLHEDDRLKWSLADVARTEAYEHFAMSRFVEQHRTVYEQMLRGERVWVEQPKPGAGARFHGRG